MEAILKILLPLGLIFGFFALVYFTISAIVNGVKSMNLNRKIKKIDQLQNSFDKAKEKVRKNVKACLNTFGEYPSEEELENIVNKCVSFSGENEYLEYLVSLIPKGIPTVDSFIEKVNKNISFIMSSISTEPSFQKVVMINPGDISEKEIYVWYQFQLDNGIEEDRKEHFRFNYNFAATFIILSQIDKLKEINESAAIDLENKIEDLVTGKYILPEWNFS